MKKCWTLSALVTTHSLGPFRLQNTLSSLQQRSYFCRQGHKSNGHVACQPVRNLCLTCNNNRDNKFNYAAKASRATGDKTLTNIYGKTNGREKKKHDNRNFLISAINQLIEKGEYLERDEWENFLQNLKQQRLIGFLPAILMATLSSSKEDGAYDVGQSLYDFVSQDKTQPNIAFLTAYILFAANHGHTEVALQSYDDLCELTDVFDSITCAKLIAAFSQMGDHWRKCLEFLEMTRLAYIPSSQHYSPIMIAAMKHDDKTLAMDLMDELHLSGFMPSDEVFMEALDLDVDFVLELIGKIRRFGWILSDNVASYLSKWFSRGINGEASCQKTQVSKRGQCKNCGVYLERHWSVTSEQFHQLRKTFLEKSLKRDGNIFINMSPEELIKFEEFLEKYEPFDVILDGLNIAGKSGKNQSLLYKVQMLRKVTEHLHGKFKKILILGRKHMEKWPVTEMKKIQGLADVYLANSITEDDPLMLYAALRSGLNTHIVTSDQLRDHRFLLGTELADIFKIWQRGHQVVFEGIWRNRDRTESLMITWPHVQEIRAQWTKDTWHIPFEDGIERESYNLTNSWLCVIKKPVSPKQ